MSSDRFTWSLDLWSARSVFYIVIKHDLTQNKQEENVMLKLAPH